MADEPRAVARADVAGALKSAAVAALLAFGLFLPLIGFKTEQSISNELVLEMRWPLLLTFVAIVAAAHLFGSLVVTPWRARRALHPAAPDVRRRRFTIARRIVLIALAAVAAIATEN